MKVLFQVIGLEEKTIDESIFKEVEKFDVATLRKIVAEHYDIPEEHAFDDQRFWFSDTYASLGGEEQMHLFTIIPE